MIEQMLIEAQAFYDRHSTIMRIVDNSWKISNGHKYGLEFNRFYPHEESIGIHNANTSRIYAKKVKGTMSARRGYMLNNDTFQVIADDNLVRTKVLSNGQFVQYPVLTDFSEENLFQLSTIYEMSTLDILLKYSMLHRLGLNVQLYPGIDGYSDFERYMLDMARQEGNLL